MVVRQKRVNVAYLDSFQPVSVVIIHFVEVVAHSFDCILLQLLLLFFFLFFFLCMEKNTFFFLSVYFCGCTHIQKFISVGPQSQSPVPLRQVSACIFTYMHTCTHTCTLSHISTHTHTHTHTQTCTHTHTHTHTTMTVMPDEDSEEAARSTHSISSYHFSLLFFLR